MDDTQGRPRHWWDRLLDRIDASVTGPVDDDARRRGWTVTVRPGTRTHVYRDPRWDRRRACDECAGTGRVGVRSCTWCDATGVVTDRPESDGGGVVTRTRPADAGGLRRDVDGAAS